MTQFPAMIDEVATRCRDLLDSGQPVTVVFDAGQNSEANIAHLASLGLHFVGSVPPSDHPDLLALPAAARELVDPNRFGGLTALDIRILSSVPTAGCS